MAAAAYNAGPGRIQKWLAKESELPRETRDYVRIITGTKAEDWIERSDALAIRIDLPREAPCEGVGSLSKTRDVAWVPVNLTPSTATIIRKAEQLAARLSANRARKRLVVPAPQERRGPWQGAQHDRGSREGCEGKRPSDPHRSSER